MCPQVSFSRGNVLTLHNLELNLAPLLGGAAALAHVRRAFARQLSITIPRTALTSQPIQASGRLHNSAGCVCADFLLWLLCCCPACRSKPSCFCLSSVACMHGTA